MTQSSPLRLSFQRIIAALLLLFHLAPLQAGAPQVVVSIKPVHSLVAGLMQGVGEPELLIRGGQSPHDFSLKPSDMRLLQQAGMIVWVGPEVESSLAHLLEKGASSGEVVTLTRIPGMARLSPREGPDWERHLPSATGHDDAGHEHGGEIDSHLWLSPQIARRIVSRLADLLSERDPANATRYRENGRQLDERLQRLDTELSAKLSPVRQLPFVVFHDAYHYFEQQYGLNAVGSVTLSPERQPGARHLHELREKITRLGARCVFAEPQFRPKLVATLTEGTGARAGRLDPLGQDLEAGAEAYFTLMRRLADDLTDCLNQASPP